MRIFSSSKAILGDYRKLLGVAHAQKKEITSKAVTVPRLKQTTLPPVTKRSATTRKK